MSLRLGFLTHVISGRTVADSLRIAVDLFQAAEDLGFDTGWVAQHRFDDTDGALPAPLVFLAAAAQRTTRIRLGTAVIVLPTEDPLAIAEQALVVDNLSGGRLELGLGTGGHPPTFAATGVDIARKHDVMAAKLDALTTALRGHPINGTSARLDPSAASLTERIWESTTRVDGAHDVGRRGHGLLLARSVYFSETPTDEHQLPVVHGYRDSLRTAAVRIGVSRTVYPAADRRRSAADLIDGVNQYAAQMIRERHFPAGLSADEYFGRSFIHHGHPDEVMESLLADQVMPHATELICQTAPGTVDANKTIAALDRIAEVVAPELRRRLPAAPLAAVR